MPQNKLSKTSEANNIVKAIALEYKSIEELPKITAQGVGVFAEQILEIARKNNIPVHQDTTLTDLLNQGKFDKQIDPDTFKLVAEVISFLYHTEKSWKEEHQFLEPVLDGKV